MFLQRKQWVVSRRSWCKHGNKRKGQQADGLLASHFRATVAGVEKAFHLPDAKMGGKQLFWKTTEKSNDCIFCHVSVENIQKMQFLSWNWLIFQTNVYQAKEMWLFTVAINYCRLLRRKVWEMNTTFHEGQDAVMKTVCIYILAFS